MERVAVYAGTRNIYHDMVVAAKSLLYHKGADMVVFLIEDNTFTEDLPECVTIRNVSDQTYFSPSGPNYECKWTYMVMIRTALTKLFPEYDRILSLDHDTIVNKPIDFIWDVDISGHYFAAVEEKQIHGRPHPYFNFGVVMHNLAKLRKDGMDDIIINDVNTHKYTYCEQDSVNALCNSHILCLPPEYNAIRFNRPFIPDSDAVIRHHAACGVKIRTYDDYKLYDRMTWEQVLAHEPEPELKTRHDVINAFIRSRNYHSFLEIGTDTGITLRNVKANKIVSVDPDVHTPATYHMTSDDYFASNDDKFDVIFIDGLHECNQVYFDILNALYHLNTGGVIIMHDCLPTSEKMQEHHTTSQHYTWTGDAWKAFVRARRILPYEMYTIDTDFGCGVIDTTIPKQNDTNHLPVCMETMTYSQFSSNRDDWMNVKGGIINADVQHNRPDT